MAARPNGATHTPGPWTAETRGDGYRIKGAIRGQAVNVATVHGMLKHDAALIAAAPDLLALAQQYYSECGDCAGVGIDIDDQPCAMCADIRAVLAKALPHGSSSKGSSNA